MVVPVNDTPAAFNVHQYDVFLANLPEITEGTHITKGPHFVVVISNNAANKHAPFVNVVPMTSKHKKPLPTHVPLPLVEETGLTKDSTVLCEQAMPLDRCFLVTKTGHISGEKRQEIRDALKTQYNMG